MSMTRTHAACVVRVPSPHVAEHGDSEVTFHAKGGGVVPLLVVVVVAAVVRRQIKSLPPLPSAGAAKSCILSE